MAAAPGGMKPFYTALGVVAVAGLGAIGWMALRPHGSVAIPVDATIVAADTAGFHGYLLGSPTAPVEVVEYADFQCPGCQRFEIMQFPTVRRQLIETGRVRWRYRDFPLDNIHSHTRVAAHAAACASDQNKYWEMHAALYAGQPDWESASNGEVATMFRGYASSVGLDVGKYDACMSSAKYAGRIQASHDEALKLNVPVTPTFLIDSKLYPGGLTSDELKHLVDSLAPAPATP